ncbi:MAG: CRISPR-associated protein Cas4 [Deltaproteobacteria bacterium]|nr:CRISPR-associated protein Cas4 [Deltaproteobacteria bacterium]
MASKDSINRPARKQFDWALLGPPVPVAQDNEATLSGAAAALQADVGLRLPPVDDAPRLMLRVNDIKQFAYCPRIVFYQYVMPVHAVATFKMEHGKAVEPRLEQLERRRRLRAYGLANGVRQFQVWLSSPRLGLSGRLDLLIITEKAAFPVDFKDTREPVRRNHRAQLCAYALLVEDTLALPVPLGFIYRVPLGDVTAVDIDDRLRQETWQETLAIRKMIEHEQMPEPTSVRVRCEECEYRNYCGDVF